MKKILLVTIALTALVPIILLIRANNPDDAGEFNETTIKFDHIELDLGSLSQGKPQPGTFTFTNTGDTPFVMTNVVPSCGCTTPEWPRNPIKPGKTGEIKVTYGAQNAGRFIKTIRVEGNVAGGYITLSIKGQVQANESNQPDQA